MDIVDEVTSDLLKHGSPPAGAMENMLRFFKTQPGGYGEGDRFLGIKVPPIRIVATAYKSLSLDQIALLAQSQWHEVRLCAAIILANRVTPKRTPDAKMREVYKFYLAHTKAWNNWDIVDLSCRQVVGGYLLRFPKERTILAKLASSSNIWERRIAVVSTWQFIREGQFADTLAIATRLLDDNHDLIHKATGWMLREVGKRDENVLKKYLDTYASKMPRTALRYAIERLTSGDKARYMAIKKQ